MNLISKKTISIISVLLITFIFSFSATAKSPRKIYKKAIKTWTHSDELYQRDDFYASMIWHVTYLSLKFLSAQTGEISAIYEYSESERARYVREQQNRFGGYDVFFVSFYGYDYKTADLGNKDSIWQLRLEAGSRRVAPVKFEELKKPTPLDIQLYPYINTWSHHYFVYFPKTSGLGTGELKLKINGPYSNGEFVW